jgi:pyruvate dehydrogenase E2 component (dihydrolipoamide acetyltransferase)
VVADASVPESEIDLFIEDFKRNFKPSTAAETGPSPKFVTAGGRRIRYLRTGPEEGVPVVLIHGFGGDLHNWLFNQEALAIDHPVYAIDLPGHGGSQKDVGDGTIGALADAACACLRALNLDQAHLVGHSLGGAVALAGTLVEPRIARSLSLISPVGLGTEINGGFISGFVQAERRREMKGLLEQLFSDTALVSREMVMNVLEAKRIDGARECLQRIAESCFAGGKQGGRLRERLAQLTIPVQVVWGTRDRIIPSAQAAHLPANVAVRMVEQTGHMAHMERAEEVNELLRRFIHSS